MVNKKGEIPHFMSENSSINYEDANASWLANNLHKLMVGVSLGWFAIVFIYITQFFGWSNLFLMMPDEFGGFLAGITLPLAVIWMVIAYIDRGTGFKTEARLLRAYMNQIVHPEEGGAQTAKAMADGIRSQVVELQQVTKLAIEQTDKIKQELGGRVEDFSKLVGVLDNYSSKTIVELTEGVKTLIKNFEYATTRAESSKDEFKSHTDEFSKSAHMLQNDMRDLIDSLIPRIQEIKGSSALLQTINNENSLKMLKANEMLQDFTDKANNSFGQASNVLTSQAKRLEDISGSAIESYKNIYQSLEEGVEKIDASLKTQGKFVADHVSMLDKNSEKLAQKLADHRENISVEVDKVIARTNTMEENIAIKTRELNKISDAVYDSLKQVETGIEEQIHNLDKQADAASRKLNEVIENLEDKTELMSKLSDQSASKTVELSDVISAKHDALQTMSDGIVNNLKLISKEISDNAQSVKTDSNASIENFNEVSSIMKKNAESLTEASSIVLAQSRTSEASLAQQQRHITSSITKIEDLKNEVRRQIEEFARVAASIDEEAGSVVERLKSQMNDILKSSDEVVGKTKTLNESLSEQSADFAESTVKTLSRVAEFEHTLNTHYQRLSETSKNVEDKTVEISARLEKQTILVDKSTDKSSQIFKEILGSFETQSNLLNSVAENTVGYISEVVQALDEKAETINVLFKHQENEFFNICEKLSDNTNAIGANLKKQITSIEQGADRVFARMALLEEDVGKRADVVVASSMKSIESLSELNGHINAQNSEMSRTVETIVDKIRGVSDAFKLNVSGFENTVKEIRDETSAGALTIAANAEKIKENGKALSLDMKAVSENMESHIKDIDIALVKAKSQSDIIKENLGSQKETLTDIVNVVSTQSRLGEASLAQQYKYLSDAATNISNKLNEINTQFKNNTDGIFETSGKLSYEFDVLGDKLIKVGEDIFKTSKNSIKSVEQVNLALGSCAEELDATVNKSTGKVRNVMEDYNKHIANFNTVTAEASTGVVEINDLISQQSDKMLTISEGTKELVECFNTVLNDTSKELSNRANMAYDKVKGLGENLKALSRQLEEATKSSATHLDKSGDKLRAAITEISSNAERISNEIRSGGEVFLKQSEVLVAATDDTLQKVGHVMHALSENAADFNNKTQDIVEKSQVFNELVKKQAKTLGEISAKAGSQLQDLEKQYQGVKLDSFLKDAGSIIEKLETVAVDISRIFSPKDEEDLWKKYYNGDTSVFIRHLAKTMTKNQVQGIRGEFEKNLDFRNMVSKYLSEFEQLIKKAQTNERSGILLSVISGADIGKLYYILAKSLDKLH